MACFANGPVTSRDAAAIGYRHLGRGPGLLLVQGSLKAWQHLMRHEPPLSINGSVGGAGS